MNPNSEIFHTCPQGKKYITTKSMYTMETLFISGWREDEERQTEKRTEGKIKQEKSSRNTPNSKEHRISVVKDTLYSGMGRGKKHCHRCLYFL